MKHVFIDLEMHPIAREYKEERAICSRETIEIGAVMLDDNYIEIDSFKSYVKPQYVKDIYTSIVMLTGITNQKLSGSDNFEKVLYKFVEWCESYDDEVKIYAWSESDYKQVVKELALKGVAITEKLDKLLDNWVDFQKEYCELVHLQNVISLEKALNMVGERFLGDMHDAFYDARNTAELFKCTRDREEFTGRIRTIEEVVQNEYKHISSFSIGELFNFDALGFVM